MHTHIHTHKSMSDAFQVHLKRASAPQQTRDINTHFHKFALGHKGAYLFYCQLCCLAHIGEERTRALEHTSIHDLIILIR